MKTLPLVPVPPAHIQYRKPRAANDLEWRERLKLLNNGMREDPDEHLFGYG